MKQRHSRTQPALIAAALLAVSTLTTHAQTWQTVDDFQYTAGFHAYGSDISTDSQGNLYAVGGASLDPNDVNRLALVNVSYDQGAHWTTLEQSAEPGWTWGHFRTFASAGGRLFIGGNGRYADWPSGSLGWLIRESTDGGLTWTTTDAMGNYSGCSDIAIHPGTGDVYAGGSSSVLGRFIRRRLATESSFSTVFSTGPVDYGSAWSIGFHTSGAVFAVGNRVDPSTGAMKWIVMKSDSGDPNTWRTNDTFSTTEWTGYSACGIAVTPAGTTYVSGWARNTKTKKVHWVVRASTDGGSTWTVSDSFALGGMMRAFDITQDAAGNLYVCGQGTDTAGKAYWIVRKGTPTTTWVKQGKKLVPVATVTWTTSDAFQLAPGMEALPLGITVDASGNVFASGRAADAGGVEHWIVRKLPNSTP